MNKFHNWIIKKNLLMAWFIFFIFAVVVALLLQLFVLPVLLPGLHAGNGLLAGGDWVGFHKIAVELAEKINVQGWSAWELRPYGHSAAGIAGAIYAISVPEPYAFIPLNAAVHATGGLILIRIVYHLTNDKIISFVSALPFVIYPSAMAWYTQINKDGFYFTGAFLFLYGWILLARLQTWQSGWRPVIMALVWICGGLALMGLVRIYSFQVMQMLGLILATGLTLLFIVRGINRILPWYTCAAAIAVLFIVPLSLQYAPVETRGSAVMPDETMHCDAAALAKMSNCVGASTSKSQGNVVESIDNVDCMAVDTILEKCNLTQELKPDRSWHGAIFAQDYWRSSGWLPARIENNFLRIATLRDGYLTTPGYVNSGSMIDTNVHLLSVNEIFNYFPRASQIGFLAPFPSHWIAPGVSSGGSIMRRVAGIEMLGVYLALLFLFYAMWHWRTKVEMWIAIVFGSILVVLYGYITPNIGSLYRLRYGFLMLLVSIGVAGLITAQRNFSKNSTH